MEPTGAIQEVGIDQLFFSTTDDKGVIEKANSVFVQLSHYSNDQLVGAPHNIIRHPMMPGGAFYVMWETIQAGKPFVAYVHNLAADGSRYDVLATITPMPDGGYLSVRTHPVSEKFMFLADQAYTQALRTESQAISQGTNRHNAAVEGAGTIAAALQGIGFPDYEDFMNLVLPTEVIQREKLSQGLPERPEAEGELADRLNRIRQIFSKLDAWIAQMDQLSALSQSLTNTRQSIRLSRNKTIVPEQLRQHLDDPNLASLRQAVDVWEQMQTIMDSTLQALDDSFIRLNKHIAQTRFRIALARLHATMAANFTAEVIDNQIDAHEEIALLTQAMTDGVKQMSRSSAQLKSLVDHAIGRLSSASRLVALPTQMAQVVRSQQESIQLKDHKDVKRIVVIIESSGTVITTMEELANQCGTLTTLPDVEELQHLITGL